MVLQVARHIRPPLVRASSTEARIELVTPARGQRPHLSSSEHRPDDGRTVPGRERVEDESSLNMVHALSPALGTQPGAHRHKPCHAPGVSSGEREPHEPTEARADEPDRTTDADPIEEGDEQGRQIRGRQGSGTIIDADPLEVPPGGPVAGPGHRDDEIPIAIQEPVRLERRPPAHRLGVTERQRRGGEPADEDPNRRLMT